MSPVGVLAFQMSENNSMDSPFPYLDFTLVPFENCRWHRSLLSRKLLAPLFFEDPYKFTLSSK